MKRRQFMTGAAAAGVAATAAASSLSKPAIAQDRVEWQFTTPWPRGFPGLGTGVQRIADSVAAMSGGSFTLNLFGAGELNPPLQVFDTVQAGGAQSGHDAAYWHLGVDPALVFFTTVPFGMTANEHNAWIRFGGGQVLWDELYAKFGLKGFLAGNSNSQMMGWFKKEINSVEDFRGLKMRIPGLGGTVLAKFGLVPTNLPGGEILPALQAGTLDAAEWVGPYNDLAFGIYQGASNYYWPGFHEMSATLAFTANISEWEALSSEHKAIIEAATAMENETMMAEFNAGSPGALRELVTEKGAILRRLNNEILVAVGNASGEVLRESIETMDDLGKQIADSWLRFRAATIPWTQIADQGAANVRGLQGYSYPTSV